LTPATPQPPAIDETFERTGIPAGPLHGLPVSLKDNYVVKEPDSTIGLVALADKPGKAEQESTAVDILRSCGAGALLQTYVFSFTITIVGLGD